MNEILILRLGLTPDEPVHWTLFASREGKVGEVLAADNAPNAYPLIELAERAHQAQMVIAVLPGEDIAMRVMPSPPRAASKFISAANYLLEDELAEGLENLHVATAKRSDGAGLAFAIKHALMQRWRDFFAEIDIAPDVMVPDYALLQNADKDQVIIEPTRMICAIGDYGFCAERSLSEQLVKKIIEDLELQELTIYGNPERDHFQLDDVNVNWESWGHSDEATGVAQLHAEASLRNDGGTLLQGEYRKRRDWTGSLRPWRRAAMLAAACLVGLIGVTIADGVRASRLAQNLDAAALGVHRSAFPESANINPRDHARRILASESVGLGFLSLTGEFAEVIGDGRQIQMERIRYNSARDEFSVNFSFSDINDLEALKTALAARGVMVRETSGVRRSGSRYIGELQVEAL